MKSNLRAAVVIALALGVQSAMGPLPVEAAEEAGCNVARTVYDDYKRDIEFWFDDHGHSGLIAPGGDWIWEGEAEAPLGDNYHNDFQDDGYAHTHHTICDA